MSTATGSRPRRLARGMLTKAVRRGAERGDAWGEAILAEFDQTATDAEAVRWTVGGLWVSWRERIRRYGLPRTMLGVVFGGGRVRSFVTVFTVTLGLLAATQQWVMTVVYVPSPAMRPTIDIGERTLVDRFGFRVTGLHTGDMVLLSPAGNGRILRVAGLPGDRLSCADGRLRRNGEVVDEPYLPSGTVTDCQPATVPDGHLYLLRDGRDVARDSRHQGAFPTDTVIGRVLT